MADQHILHAAFYIIHTLTNTLKFLQRRNFKKCKRQSSLPPSPHLPLQVRLAQPTLWTNEHVPVRTNIRSRIVSPCRGFSARGFRRVPVSAAFERTNYADWAVLGILEAGLYFVRVMVMYHVGRLWHWDRLVCRRWLHGEFQDAVYLSPLPLRA
jgi:hypothetical protein